MNTPPQAIRSIVFFYAGLILLAGGILGGCISTDSPRFQPFPPDQSLPEDIDQYLKVENVLIRLGDLSIREQLDSLLLLTDLLKNHQEDVALVYAQEANRLAVMHNKPFSRGISSYYVALLNGGKEIYGEGIEDPMVDAQISRSLFATQKKPVWLARTNRLIGNFFYRRSEFDSAKVYLFQALDIVENHGLFRQDSLMLRGEVFFELANVYAKSDTTKLISAYQESLKMFQATQYQSAIARLQLNMGRLYTSNKKFDKAENMLKSSLRYAESQKDSNLLVLAKLRMGDLRKEEYRLFSQEKRFFEAKSYFQQVLRFQKENNYSTYEYLGITYQLRAQRTNNLAFLDTALIYYKEAMNAARQEGALSVVKNMGNNISLLCAYLTTQTDKNCEDILNASPAVFFNRNYTGIVDKMRLDFDLANVRKIEFERTELQTQAAIRRRNQLLVSVAIFIIALLIFFILYLHQQQQRLQARMDALRAQINPHFISNSLNAIENLVNMNKREEASKYLIHFSRFSRRILNGSRNANISLEEELETTRHFLALEKLRFRDKLNYEIGIAEGLNPKMIEVPAMILQPYLENAILHGIKPKSGPGLLKIQVEQTGKYLLCIIEDNGIGRERSRQLKEASLQARKSMGMAITEERVRGMGKNKGAKVEIKDLADASGEASGTQVILRLPLKLLKDSVK